MPKRILSVITITMLTISQVLFSFPFNLPAVKEAHAATRLGLHVTQEELNCWRQRAGIDPQGSNGITCPVKYRTTGDVQTNSPGDWNSIISRAATFAGNLYMDNWQGQTASGPWAPDGHTCNYTQGSGGTSGCVPTFSQGENILAAGFATFHRI